MFKLLSDFLIAPAPKTATAKAFPITTCGISLAELKQDVWTAMHFLRTHTTDTHPIALYSADSYFFLVNLLAAWQLNKHVVVPGDRYADIESNLIENNLIGDFSQPLYREILPKYESNNIEFKKLDPHFNAITVYTSGSTGQPEKIAKTIAQLEHEIFALQTNFGAYLTPGVTQVLSTVSHQHFYGLPFRLLWPICSGAVIARTQIIFPNEWSQITHPHILISSPVFLKRALQSDLSKIKNTTTAIYSAGGPLSSDIQDALHQQLYADLIEIYGSSETGSIAWRLYPQTNWVLQPNVQIALNDSGLLKIKSSFLPDQHWFQTQDQAKLTGQTFELLGRADNIVKIEEKRISLTRIEQVVQQSPLIETCATVVLNSPSRMQIGMAATLTDLGVENLQAHGRWQFCQRLRAAAAPYLEPIAIPRTWRFVIQLPVNHMGKTTRTELIKLFSHQLKQPLIINAQHTAHSIQLLLDINKNLACLAGHFPNWPIVPGVAQIEWAIDFAKQFGFQGKKFSTLEVIKFQKPLIPNKLITLNLVWNQTRQLTFIYLDQHTTYSSGRICFL